MQKIVINSLLHEKTGKNILWHKLVALFECTIHNADDEHSVRVFYNLLCFMGYHKFLPNSNASQYHCMLYMSLSGTANVKYSNITFNRLR